MIRINDTKIPYFPTEITFSNYVDFLNDGNQNFEILTGVNFDFIQDRWLKKKLKSDILKNCNYSPERVDNFVHDGNLYIYPKMTEITLLEGILCLNYANEFSKPKYMENGKGFFAIRMYLISTLCKKIVDGIPETIPTNLGESLNFVENRLQELKNLSIKNAVDFEAFYSGFEKKLKEPFFHRAFKGLHPTKIGRGIAEMERQKRFSDFYGAFGIFEYLKTHNLISGLETPFFHALFIYGISVNKP